MSETNLTESTKAFAIQIVRRLVQAGFRAYFAGGCVRDMLRGETPKDFDVATSATPEQVMQLFRRTVPVGAAFGVVRVLSHDDPPIQIEVATFRADATYSDGRHPDAVTFTDEIHDVKRRDFTVNGLLYDPRKDEVLDYVDGRRDLDRKLIRAIGDPRQRFAEDHLRMLRAVRFACNLGFELDGATLDAIKELAKNITAVSAERIRDEFSKMLTGANPRRALELLKKTCLLKHILPEVDVMEGVKQPPQFHPEGDVWVHTLMLLGQLDHAPLTLTLGALFHDVGKPPTYEFSDRIRFNEHEHIGADMTEKILTRLKYPNDVIQQAVSLVKQHMVFKDVTHMRPATLKRFIRQSHFEEHLALHRLDCIASHGDLSAFGFCQEEVNKQPPQALRPAPLITGVDLIGLGLTPGPKFKTILKEIEDRQLEGALTTKDAALACAREMIGKLN